MIQTDIIEFEPPQRIYSQYNRKPKMLAWLNINRNIVSQMYSNIKEIHMMYDADRSSGHMLDILGELVGFKRPVMRLENLEVDAQFGRSEFGGAEFNSSNPESFKSIDDEMYRMLIKAKIFKNNSDASPDSIVTAVRFITNTECIVHEIKLAYYIEFQDSISDTERYIFEKFDLLPRAHGVKFLRFEEKNKIHEFGRDQFGSGAQFNAL